MTQLEKGIVDLIKSGITGEKITLPNDFEWEEAYKVSSWHQITPIIYYGASQSECVPPPEVMKQLKVATAKSLFLSTNQLQEIDKIIEVFENNDIAYMLLKGSILKHIYPKPEMRQMCDIDIMIKTEQYEKIQFILKELCFEELKESDHEFVWKKDKLTLELHKRLIPSYNKDYYAYFGDGWQFAQSTDGCRYELNDEDNFIYLFTHYAKHYRNGVVDARHLTDFKVFLDAKKNLDIRYVEEELEKLQLLEFYKNTMATLDVWFRGAEPTAITETITDRMFRADPYNIHDSQIIADAVKKSKSNNNLFHVRSKKVFSLMFPSASVLSKKYPILKKYPYLLPIIWVVRGVDILFNKTERIKQQSDNLKLISEENVSRYQQELNFVGLDFNFKE